MTETLPVLDPTATLRRQVRGLQRALVLVVIGMLFHLAYSHVFVRDVAPMRTVKYVIGDDHLVSFTDLGLRLDEESQRTLCAHAFEASQQRFLSTAKDYRPVGQAYLESIPINLVMINGQAHLGVFSNPVAPKDALGDD